MKTETFKTDPIKEGKRDAAVWLSKLPTINEIKAEINSIRTEGKDEREAARLSSCRAHLRRKLAEYLNNSVACA